MLFDARSCDLLCLCEVTGMLAAAALCAWTVSGSEMELFSTSGAVGICLETVSHMAVESVLLPFLRISL